MAGQRWTRHVVLARAAAPAARLAALKVDTGPAPAQVFVDGTLAGPAPFTQAGLSAGEHVIRVEFRSGAAVERTVTLPAGETVAVMFGPPAARAAVPAAPAAGWVRVDAPFDVQVFRAGEIVGSSRSERIMLPAGPHVLELVNTALGYRAPVKTTIVAGTISGLVGNGLESQQILGCFSPSDLLEASPLDQDFRSVDICCCNCWPWHSHRHRRFRELQVADGRRG